MDEKQEKALQSARPFLREHNLDGLEAVPLAKGISNDNFLLGHQYVLKVPYDKNYITLSEGKVNLEKEAAKRFLSPDVVFCDYNSGILLTEFLPGFHSLEAYKLTLSQIVNIVKAVKEFHTLPRGTLAILEYEKMLDSFRLKISPKERIYLKNIEYSPLLDFHDEVSHFDLVDNNIMVDKSDNVRLIDYEFCCLTPRYFDLISLLTENDFSLTNNVRIIDEYFKDDKDGKEEFFRKRRELTLIADLLWYHWAKARSLTDDPEKKKAYLDIASQKKVSLIENMRKVA